MGRKKHDEDDGEDEGMRGRGRKKLDEDDGEESVSGLLNVPFQFQLKMAS